MISGHTKLAAVIATPIKHSISPLIHNTAFQSLGIDAVYVAFEVGPESLAQVFESIRVFDMLGVNLSMPNKQRGFELVDEVSQVAELLGAINTVVNQDGHLIGHSTDGEGFIQSLRDEGVEIQHKKMILLGAGGAALAIIAQAAVDGIDELVVFKRNIAENDESEIQLNRIAEKTNCKIRLLALEAEASLKAELRTADILVNTTSVGMTPHEGGNLIPDGSWLKPNLVVADIIYEPRETALLTMAKQQGCQTLNGLGMLLHQGALAFKLWTGEDMPVDEVRLALKNIT